MVFEGVREREPTNLRVWRETELGVVRTREIHRRGEPTVPVLVFVLVPVLVPVFVLARNRRVRHRGVRRRAYHGGRRARSKVVESRGVGRVQRGDEDALLRRRRVPSASDRCAERADERFGGEDGARSADGSVPDANGTLENHPERRRRVARGERGHPRSGRTPNQTRDARERREVIVRETREETKRRGGRFAFPFAVRIGANEAQEIEDARAGEWFARRRRFARDRRRLGVATREVETTTRERRRETDARGDLRTPLEERR